MYPGVMPDLFNGEMLLIAFGRYSGKGAAACQNHRHIERRQAEFREADVRFTGQDFICPNGYIPRSWATAGWSYLLDQIRMHGESAELKDEVTRLAREHGIVTPYTAYLILEDEKTRNDGALLRMARVWCCILPAQRRIAGADSVRRTEAAMPEARTGAKAVDAARDVAALKENENLDQFAQNAQQDALNKPASAPVTAGGGNNDGTAHCFNRALRPRRSRIMAIASPRIMRNRRAC